MTGTQLQQKFLVTRTSYFCLSLNEHHTTFEDALWHCKYYVWFSKHVTALASTQLASKWFSVDVVDFIADKKHQFLL